MLKNGRYCLYKGNEYVLTKNMKSEYLIITNDTKLIDSNFIDLYNSGSYSAVVGIDDIDEIYDVKTLAKYGDTVVQVIGEKDEEICLAVFEAQEAKKLGFSRTDKYSYTKWLPKGEMAVYEEKTVLK